MAGHGSDSRRDVLLRFLEILNTGDVHRMDEVADEGLLTVHPQTRERIQGLDDNKEMVRGFVRLGGITISEEDRELLGEGEEHYLLTPLFTMVKVQGSGEALVVTTSIRYPDGSNWHTIGLADFLAGKIVKQVLFFAPTLEPPAWRAEWVEALEGEKGLRIERAANTEPQGSGTADRTAAERLFELMEVGDHEHLDEVFRADVVTDYPQTGERVMGLENLRKIMGDYPGGPPRVSSDERLVVGDRGDRRVLTPADSVLRIRDTGDRLVTSIKTRYPDGSDWYTVSVFAFLEGKISKQVLYFAPVMPAPEWRAKWVVAEIGQY